jgi:pyruvoyl-dependent arginine decarboxylase (PvlArgDC)
MKIPAVSVSLAAILSGAMFAQKIPVPDLAQKSVELSSLTSPGAIPFHLKATIQVKGRSYSSEIDEYWMSPTKWRRTIKSPSLNQTIVVNGDSHYELNEGEYFPVGLQTLSQALFQPFSDQILAGLGQSKVKLNFYDCALASANVCDSNTAKTGNSPNQGTLFQELCFSGNPAIVSRIRVPFYEVTFSNRQPFGKLSVARHLVAGGEGGLEWDADVTELSAITDLNEQLFAPAENTPEDQRFKVWLVPEDGFRKQFKNTPTALALPVSNGKAQSGTVAVFVSIDKDAYVAESWAEAGLEPEVADAIHQQVAKWRFSDKPDGATRMVQLETFLTLSFTTQLNPSAGSAPAAQK